MKKKSELKLHFPTTAAFPLSPTRVTTCPCLCPVSPEMALRIFCFSNSSPSSQPSAVVERQQPSTVGLIRFMLLGNSFLAKASVGDNSWLLGLFFLSRRESWESPLSIMHCSIPSSRRATVSGLRFQGPELPEGQTTFPRRRDDRRVRPMDKLDRAWAWGGKGTFRPGLRSPAGRRRQ